MRPKMFTLIVLLLAGGAASARGAEERPFLHPLFSDDMILQRGVAAPIWGWARPGEKVTVQLNGRKDTAVADQSGKWMAHIGPLDAGGPYAMIVSGPQSVTINNVLIGDVWIASGQSNMEMGIGGVNNASDEIASGDFPQIRLFTVPKKIAVEPERLVDSRWYACRPDSLNKTGFSAVAYFFGRQLHKDLKVPIGLIHTSWGGTVAEAWTSPEALKTIADFKPALEEVERARADLKLGAAGFEQRMDAWWAKNDAGSAKGQSWAGATFDASSWKSMDLPQRIEAGGLPDHDGIVWFRREFELPASFVGKDVTLHLGPIDDIDTTFVNGTKVGGKESWEIPRVYKVPRALLKPGRNVIAVRVLDTAGAGGIYGSPEDLRIELTGGSKGAPISLVGPWRYQASTPADKLSARPQKLDGNPNVVTVLYNGMIAPLAPFAIKGAIWYQGESNVGRPEQYRKLLATMIADWRSRFGGGDFPFLIVQLANFLPTKPEPGESSWAELREAQTLVTKDVPKTGLAVAIDIGDAADIHPKNKQDVGRRLALAALGVAYGKQVEFSGPSFRAMKVEGNRVRLSFDHLGGGLETKGAPKLQGFAVAGANKHFVWANALIEGDDVIVSAPEVANPQAVRYAWAENPVCNLYNKAGLPAVPFRTDLKSK